MVESARQPWWLDRKQWTEATHNTPFGHCAGCGTDLPIRTGADGAVIASIGHCYDCDLTTVWEATDAT